MVSLFDAATCHVRYERDEDTCQRGCRSFRELPKGTRPVYIAHQTRCPVLTTPSHPSFVSYFLRTKLKNKNKF